ncbi:hypothetical protein AB0D86_47620 [Streptomyces sp. NPDC048324]
MIEEYFARAPAADDHVGPENNHLLEWMGVISTPSVVLGIMGAFPTGYL